MVKAVFCEVDGFLCLFMNFGSSPCKLSTELCNNLRVVAVLFEVY